MPTVLKKHGTIIAGYVCIIWWLNFLINLLASPPTPMNPIVHAAHEATFIVGAGIIMLLSFALMAMPVFLVILLIKKACW